MKPTSMNAVFLQKPPPFKRYSTAMFFFLLVIRPFPGLSSLNTDSLMQVTNSMDDSKEKVQNLAQLFNAFLHNDPERAKKYALEEIAVAERIDYMDGAGTGYYHLGVYYNNTDRTDSARYFYEVSGEIFEKINRPDKLYSIRHALAILEYSQGNFDESIQILEDNIRISHESEYDSIVGERELDLAIAHDLLGVIQVYKGKYNLALRNALIALKYLENLDKPIRKADALNHLAIVEFYLNNFRESIRYNLEALEVYRRNNDLFYEAQVLNDIGNGYYYLKEYDSAVYHLERSLALAEQMGSKDLAGTAMNNLGKVFTELREFEKAISYSKAALELHTATGSKNKIVESLNDLGIAYNAASRPSMAIDYLNRSVKLAREIDTKDNLKIAYFNRSEAYEMLGEIELALTDFKNFKAIDDSIRNVEKGRQIEEMRAIYELESREKEIELQKNEINLLEARSKVVILQRSMLASGLVLISVVFFLVYYSMRQKMRRNKLEREKVDAELSFKIRELTSHAMHLANKNELLEDLKLQIEQLKQNGFNGSGVGKILNTIRYNLQDDKNWDNFIRYFENVHPDFGPTIKEKYPDITPNELRLMALIKMNLSSKEIANILNISPEGVKKARYRLRKKMNITNDDSLYDQLIGL